MKKYLLGLTGLALLGGAPLRAQETTVERYIGQTGGSSFTSEQEIRVGPGGAQGRIVCVPEHYIKKTNRWCFGHMDFRVCQCHFHGLFGKCGCDQGHCEHSYCRRVMVKKLRVEESDRTRCVPREVPGCGYGGAAGCRPGVGMPGAPLIPPPGTVNPLPGAPLTAPGQFRPPTP